MTNQSNPKLSIQVVIAIIGAVVAICTAIIAIVPFVLPLIIKPTPTAIQSPTSILPAQPILETSVIPTDTPNLVQPATIAVSDTLVPTFTPTLTPTLTPTFTSTSPPLADLIVVAISNPVCTRDHRFTPTKVYVKINVTVRNIGPGSTNSLGPSSVRVNLIFGQARFSLDEWASKFNGVVNDPDLEVTNLNPNDDSEIKLSIDLKGNANFSIEAIANSGPNIIPESDTTNNILTQNFSIDCK